MKKMKNMKKKKKKEKKRINFLMKKKKLWTKLETFMFYKLLKIKMK